MARVFNFSAGPAVLPEEVLREAAEEMLDYKGTGMSVMEMSHRSKMFQDILDDAEQDFRELLGVPANYKVLFIQGGGHVQFAMVPLNLMKNRKAEYIVTGQWAKKAMQEAALYGDVRAVASSEDKVYSYIPDCTDLPIREDADYLYFCKNNTIYGTEIHEDITSPVPLIADMSSDIMSRPVDVKKYAVIYGGAQKNVGPAGVTFAIIRKDMFGRSGRTLPAMENYATHWSDEEKNRSMYNTPPVSAIFLMHETLKWVKENGGVAAMLKRNQKKAATLYAEIERNKMFVGTAEKEDRSIMNVCFVMAKGYEDKQDAFLDYATKQGMVGLKGHRSVGGFRASIYNACSQEDVEALVACMRSFEKENA